MHKVFSSVLVGATLMLAGACSSDSPATTGGAAGTAASGAAGTAPNPGGSGAATGGAGAAGIAGSMSSSSGAGGSASLAGAATGGAAGMTSSGGQSGGGGGGGEGGGGHVVKMSAGCGNMNPAKGARTIVTGGQTAMFNVNLPTNYDASKPIPLGFGFHGFMNPACGPTGGEC